MPLPIYPCCPTPLKHQTSFSNILVEERIYELPLQQPASVLLFTTTQYAHPTTKSDSMFLLPQIVSSFLFFLPTNQTHHTLKQNQFSQGILLHFSQRCPHILMYGCNIPRSFWWVTWRGFGVLAWLRLSYSII